MADAVAWPPGWGIRILPSTRRPRRRLLVGGTPLRAVRLSEAGATHLDHLVAGHPADGPVAGRLARTLTTGGLAAPAPSGVRTPEWSIVVPVRDRPDGLRATLAALEVPSSVEVVVVDDASVDPCATEATVGASGLQSARVVRRRAHGGPAGARNTGWRDTRGEVVVFLDADCTPAQGWHETLLAHFGDPALGAVAPRVTSTPGGSVLARYERHRSPLDLGPAPAPVRPGGAVPYVPSAALAVRREVLEALGGFDESMPVGEDVDLVWRLAAAGWAVRYEPAAAVGHPPRDRWARWAAQRISYGRSAGPLARRHGAAVAPLRLSGPSAAVWAVAVAVGPAAGAAAGLCAVAAAAWRLPGRTGLPVRTVASLAARGQLASGKALAEALRRTWWPLTALALAGRRRRRLLVLTTVPLLWEWAAAGRPVALPSWIAARLADDVAYGTGVWFGAVRAGAPAALLPSRQAPAGRA